MLAPYLVVYPKLCGQTMFKTFCINRDHLYLILKIVLPCGEGYMAEICALLGKLSLSLLVILSCDGLYFLLDGWMMGNLSWKFFPSFMVEFCW